MGEFVVAGPHGPLSWSSRINLRPVDQSNAQEMAMKTYKYVLVSAVHGKLLLIIYSSSYIYQRRRCRMREEASPAWCAFRTVWGNMAMDGQMFGVVVIPARAAAALPSRAAGRVFAAINSGASSLSYRTMNRGPPRRMYEPPAESHARPSQLRLRSVGPSARASPIHRGPRRTYSCWAANSYVTQER
jgi:hypothetical protein